MEEVVVAQGVSVDYGGGPVLDALDLVVEGPGLFGILGPNGSGKTTLLNLLSGLARPQAGSVRLFGQDLGQSEYPRRRVGVVLQKECAFEGIRVGEYAELFEALYGVTGGAREILDRSHTADKARLPMASLSGGEAQRLTIAAATVHSPDLVLLDEPTAHLDPETRREVGRWLKSQSTSKTIIMTTHDLKEAEVLFDRAAFLVGGRIKAIGPTAELKAAFSTLEEAFFHHCSVRVTPEGEKL